LTAPEEFASTAKFSLGKSQMIMMDNYHTGHYSEND
jgi:hypothetical protein